MSAGVDDLALQLECRRCGATADVWCRTTSGGRATELHTARTNLLWLAYEYGRLRGATEERVATAVRVLSQHKVRGEDGLVQATMWAEGRLNSVILGPAPPRIMG